MPNRLGALAAIEFWQENDEAQIRFLEFVHGLNDHIQQEVYLYGYLL
ncbi:hypothetical protein [Desulfitobacterium hafniense]|nr:hypothetical protein [Desulfitobacterium hafniense]